MSIEHTINFLHNRIEVELPDQLDHASQILRRMTLNYYGQLALWQGEPAQVISLFTQEGSAA